MKFEQVVPDINSIPEPFRPLYKQTDAGYEMPPEVFSHVDTSGLTKALETERTNARNYGKVLKEWGALGFESVEAAKTRFAELQEELGKRGTSEGAFEKFKQEAQVNLQKVQQEAEAREKKMQGTLVDYLVVGEAARVLAEEKGSNALLLPIIKSQTTVVEENGKYVVRVVDEQGDPRFSHSTNTYMSLSELVKSLKTHPEYGKAFEPSGPSAGGMRPGAAATHRAADPSKMSATDKIRAGLNESR